MSTNLEGRIDICLRCTDDAVSEVAIRSTRPHLAQKLMAGRGPEEAADLAGLIFSLCGKAQRVAAQAACEAAAGRMPVPDESRQREQAVLMERAGEHAWRLLLDWPEQAGRSPDMSSLLALRQAEPARFADVLDGLLETVLRESPARWAERNLAGFDAWRHQGATQIARLFADLGDGPDLGISRVPMLPALPLLDSDLAADLARHALADTAFCSAPHWLGEPAETGALARVADHPILEDWIAQRGRGAGARFLARLLELAATPQRLRDEAGQSVEVRSWALHDQVGLAGVETSRGLLLHVVRLHDGRVADYRIVAPTEWNFQPRGSLAQALAGLAAGDGLAARAQLVSRSLDPCVAYGVELSDA
jgi:coenzyme F420-reducing hydrogenase alpha subunit